MEYRKNLAWILVFVLLFSAILSFGVSVQAEDPLSQDLILHCKFDENVSDSSVSSNQIEVVGNIEYVDGILGKAAKFDGESYMELESQNNFDSLSEGYTISVWVYKDEIRPLREQPIIQKLGNSDDEAPSFALSDNDFQPYLQVYTVDENFDAVYNTKIDMQMWTLLTVTYDLNNVKFYENGVLKLNKTIKGTIPTNTGKVHIGFNNYNGSSFFKGYMDDLRVYNSILTPTQVKAVFDEGNKAKKGIMINPPKQLVAYYKFDNDVKDYSGLNNHGNVVGDISYVNGITGKGAKFDGSSYIEVNDNDSLDLTKGYTFSLWVNKEDAGTKREQPILIKQGNSFDIEQAAYALSDNESIPYVQAYTVHGNYDSIYIDNTFEKKKWTMLTASYDGKNVKFYMNGVLIGNKVCEGSIPASSGKLLIGFNEYDGSSFFNGIMDELRIYNYVLTAEQVKGLYAPNTAQTAKELKLAAEKLLSKQQANITREEACELAVKLYEALSGKSAAALKVNPFTDTKNQYVLKACNLKLISGISSNKFAPGNTVTQQGISDILIKTVNVAKLGLNLKQQDALRFTNEADIMAWSIEDGKLVNLNSANMGTTSLSPVMPKGNVSKGQAVNLIKNTYLKFSQFVWNAKPEGGGEWLIRPEGGGEW